MPATVMSRFSYPKVPGDALWSVADVVGPASYTQVTTGTPATGGQTVTAADFGLQSIDMVVAMGSDNGQYDVTIVPTPFNAGAPFTSMTLLWTVAATGAQVTGATNLSARTVRLLAIGR